MCGITGIYAFNESGRFNLINLQKTIDIMDHRGPDAQGSHFDERVGLGHRRLAVIDTSSAANQPMFDPSGRYALIFNGEIYNYRFLKKELEEKFHVCFKTHSDTEVLLYACIYYGEKCLDKLNGFFAFAFYDQKEKDLLIARDRFGIKPVYTYHDDDKFLFASEMRSIMAFGIERAIDYDSLLLYFQLNYIPAPFSILKNVRKLLPGHYIRIRNHEVTTKKYYTISQQPDPSINDYRAIKKTVTEKIEQSVSDRLVADVPLGVFLSGGIDSSIITALASRHRENLNTFSIGYEGASWFDESHHAEEVARHFNTHHHTFRVNRLDLLSRFREILEHIDEPFADSSAIPVYLLSELTRNHVTVALSGDGADEVFSGYNKHMAFYRARKNSLFNLLIRGMQPLWRVLPQSRNHMLADKVRQLNRYSAGLNLNGGERYWRWASLEAPEKVIEWLAPGIRPLINAERLYSFKQEIVASIQDPYTINDILLADTHFILPNDMLYKVDLMSMAHGLEVRVPFLDHQLVEYAFSIPSRYKMNGQRRKMILRDILKDMLPGNLYKRPKHGFEVPLLEWFRNELRFRIDGELLERNFIKEQEIFNPMAIENIKKQLFSSNPGDAPAHIWALIVFQSWWKKYFE